MARLRSALPKVNARRSSVHPASGAAYLTGGSGGTWTAAALWLFVLAALILAYRNEAAPTASQFLTLGAGALGVVIAAALAPAPVALVLAGIVLLAVANVPGVGGLFTAVNQRIAGLVSTSGGGGPGPRVQ